MASLQDWLGGIFRSAERGFPRSAGDALLTTLPRYGFVVASPGRIKVSCVNRRRGAPTDRRGANRARVDVGYMHATRGWLDPVLGGAAAGPGFFGSDMPVGAGGKSRCV